MTCCAHSDSSAVVRVFAKNWLMEEPRQTLRRHGMWLLEHALNRRSPKSHRSVASLAFWPKEARDVKTWKVLLAIIGPYFLDMHPILMNFVTLESWHPQLCNGTNFIKIRCILRKLWAIRVGMIFLCCRFFVHAFQSWNLLLISEVQWILHRCFTPLWLYVDPLWSHFV